jgi:hypothetical protein
MSEEGDPLEEAWAALDEAWDDDERHRKFIALCQTLGRLPEAGRRYREAREGEEPERAKVAERQIDRLLTAAMKNLEPLRAEPPRRTRSALLLAAVLITLTLVGIALWAIPRLH